MVGGVGQRMLGSVSMRMAGEFFGNVGAALGGADVTAPGAAQPVTPATGGVGQVFTAPPRPVSSQQDFLKGVAVGAGLVLLGVVFGGLFGRRRR
jgi:hypothetical protein